MNTFRLFDLPTEIQYLVLDSCSNKTLTRVLSVSRKINSVVKDVMANRMSRACGLPASILAGSTHSQPQQQQQQQASHGQILLRAYSPEDLSQTSANWFDTIYLETNNRSEFNYDFDHPYSSAPSSAATSDEDQEGDEAGHTSDTDMKASTPRSQDGNGSGNSKAALAQLDSCFKEDLLVHSKFKIKSHLRSTSAGMQNAGNNQTVPATHPLFRRREYARRDPASRGAAFEIPLLSSSGTSISQQPANQIAKLDIVDGDLFGQVVLQISLTLGPTQQVPVVLFQKTQRVYADWVYNDEYLLHNKELTCRLQVTQSDPSLRTNDFGEKYRTYEVLMQELVFNTGYLLGRMEEGAGDRYEMIQYRMPA